MKNKENVIEWARAKNLLKRENSMAQFMKLLEEVTELGTALVKKNEEETVDALGDILVVLIILAEQNNMDLESCLDSAYHVIKNRTGVTKDGIFTKDK